MPARPRFPTTNRCSCGGVRRGHEVEVADRVRRAGDQGGVGADRLGDLARDVEGVQLGQVVDEASSRAERSRSASRQASSQAASSAVGPASSTVGTAPRWRATRPGSVTTPPGPGRGEDLDVLARDEPGHRSGERRVAEDDDTFDPSPRRPAEEQPVGPDRVGADPCPGRRFGQQRPAGAFGEDPRGGAGVVARDHDRARPRRSSSTPAPAGRLAPGPRWPGRRPDCPPRPPPRPPRSANFSARDDISRPKSEMSAERSSRAEKLAALARAEELAVVAGGHQGSAVGQQRFLELEVEMGRSPPPGRDLRRRVELLR